MKAPFVTRKTHERVVARLKAELMLARAARQDAERSLDLQMQAAKGVQARATFERDTSSPYFSGRRLRCDFIVDDRMIVGGMEETMKAALADSMAYKARQAVLTLDFALARGIMSSNERSFSP